MGLRRLVGKLLNLSKELLESNVAPTASSSSLELSALPSLLGYAVRFSILC
jgi:hypothetical protein